MKLEKISNGQYLGTVNEHDLKIIIDALNSLSDDKLDEYEDTVNQMFVDTIVARYTASEFFKKYPIKDNFFTLVDVGIFERTVTVSVGCIMVSENTYKKTSGVLYK